VLDLGNCVLVVIVEPFHDMDQESHLLTDSPGCYFVIPEI